MWGDASSAGVVEVEGVGEERGAGFCGRVEVELAGLVRGCGVGGEGEAGRVEALEDGQPSMHASRYIRMLCDAD